MALTAASFIEPAGELSEEMFPGKDLDEFAAAWLADAVARTDSEAAQRAWVYHRAYGAIANRFNLEAASEKKGDATAARLGEQLAHWRARAREELHEYHALTGALGGAYLQPVGYEPAETEV